MPTRTILAAAPVLAAGILIGWLASGRLPADVPAEDKPPERAEPGKLSPLPAKLPPCRKE
jgi:hypothetical protein